MNEKHIIMIGVFINTMKTFFRFKFWFIPRPFKLQVYKEVNKEKLLSTHVILENLVEKLSLSKVSNKLWLNIKLSLKDKIGLKTKKQTFLNFRMRI